MKYIDANHSLYRHEITVINDTRSWYINTYAPLFLETPVAQWKLRTDRYTGNIFLQHRHRRDTAKWHDQGVITDPIWGQREYNPPPDVQGIWQVIIYVKKHDWYYHKTNIGYPLVVTKTPDSYDRVTTNWIPLKDKVYCVTMLVDWEYEYYIRPLLDYLHGRTGVYADMRTMHTICCSTHSLTTAVEVHRYIMQHFQYPTKLKLFIEMLIEDPSFRTHRRYIHLKCIDPNLAECVVQEDIQ